MYPQIIAYLRSDAFKDLTCLKCDFACHVWWSDCCFSTSNPPAVQIFSRFRTPTKILVGSMTGTGRSISKASTCPRAATVACPKCFPWKRASWNGDLNGKRHCIRKSTCWILRIEMCRRVWKVASEASKKADRFPTLCTGLYRFLNCFHVILGAAPECSLRLASDGGHQTSHPAVQCTEPVAAEKMHHL